MVTATKKPKLLKAETDSLIQRTGGMKGLRGTNFQLLKIQITGI